MKKIILLFFMLLWGSLSHADSNVDNLTSKTTPASADETYIVDIAGGTVDKKTTISGIFASANITANNSNVGIGSTNPGQALDVQGTVRAIDFIGKSPVLDVRAYGAVCNGTTDDTTAIQSALNAANTFGGATVYIPKSTLISSTLLIYSNTTLKVEPSATVYYKTSTNGIMLENESFNAAQRTITDGAINSGSASFSSPAQANFTSADIGRSVIISGAGNGGNTLVATITAVGSSTSATININAQTTVSSGATVTFWNRDKNINVIGGTWERLSDPATLQRQINFEHADYIKVMDVNFITPTGADDASAIIFLDTTQVYADRLNFNIGGDGVHLTGPDSYVTVRNLSGSTLDDGFAITPTDYTGNADTQGNINNVSMENISTTSATVQVKVIGGTGYSGSNITFKNIFGNQGANPIFEIIDDTTGLANYNGLVIDGVYTNTTAQYPLYIGGSLGQDVTIKNLFVQNTITASSTNEIFISGTWQFVTIDGLTDVTSSADRKEVNVTTGAVLGKLSLSNVFASSLGNASLYSYIFWNDGTVTDAIIRDSQITNTSNVGNNLFWLNSGAVSHLTISNVEQTGGQGMLYYYSGSVTDAKIVNVRLNSASRFANFYANANLTLTNISFNTLTSAAIYANNAVITIRGYGIDRQTAWSGLQLDTGSSAECLNPDFPTDVSVLTQTNGDVCYNTNSAVSAGVGKVISDGTNWHSLNLNKILTSNVGIGTTSNPSGNFQLFNNGMANGNVMVGNNIGIGSWMPASTLPISGGGSKYWSLATGGNVGINTTNNVGIGTITAGSALVVVGTGVFTTGVQTGTGSATITGNGANVGIGSTASGAALDVNGTVRMTGFQMNNGANSSYYLKSDGSGNGTWQTVSGGTSQWFNTTGGVSSVGIGTVSPVGIGTNVPAGILDVESAVYPTVFYGNGTNGNVGIGTAIPTSAFQVKTSGSTYVGIGTTAQVNTLEVIGTIAQGAAGAESQPVSANGNYFGGNVGIGTWLTTAGLMVASGNVGIGTSGATVSAPLMVNGAARINGNIEGGVTGNIGIGTFFASSATCDSVCNTTNARRCFGGLNNGVATSSLEPCSATITGDCWCLPQ